jgi:DNA polymerase I-like protein with 3'-5' exonuclease and polymerase domains/phage/plasmid-associated DNA primase
MNEAPRTYADHVVDYAQAGWPCILPVPPGDKFPPPSGFTGAEGIDTDPLQLVAWAGSHAHSSIALRMPDGVIGIDVDQYLKKGVQKHGAETLDALIAELGPLPATWSSTARGDAGGPGVSRVMLFQVPAQRYTPNLTAGGTGDIEIIQRHHRYIVVAPSVNPETGTVYRWYDPQGQPSDKVPGPMDLAVLPPAWVNHLREGATAAGPASADHYTGAQLLDQLEGDWRPECAHITNSRLLAIDEVTRAEAGSRHDSMTASVHGVILAAASGHQGVAWSIAELRTAWDNLTAGEDRGPEFESMLLTSARKAVTLVGQHQVVRDPCLTEDAFAVFASAPQDAAGNPVEAIAPVMRFSVREVIGTHLFDPVAQLDQPLAQAVLERTYPVIRYASDSGGWLLRLPDRWELHPDLRDWAVAQVATLMPVGDPGADKDSEQKARSSRRARLQTQAGAKAIAGKMGALVAGGLHPCAVQLGNLDSQPHVLWAGGFPWDLAACRPDVPMEDWIARIDPTTPHLHTAGVTPERVPTPLWDAFLAAVWPDPEVRAWSLRVLSIALTGYPDRALPILIGDTGRGKTQVVSLLMSVLGSYAHAADPRLLGAEGAKAHASIVFALKGRRLSFIDEGPREGRFAQERLKQLTGGGELTANQMNQNPITFSPTHTLLLTTNDEPVLTDPAIRSRARLIPCDGDPELVRVTRAAIGHPNSAQWRAEAPGVLAQMMAEAGAWLEDPTSAHVTAAPEKLRYLAETLGHEQDPIRVWVDEETEPTDNGTPSRELYQAFVASCRRSGIRADAQPSETRWGRALNRLGYPVTHTKHGKTRPLRVRNSNFMPGMGLQAPPAAEAPGDGLTPKGDGLVTGSDTQPVTAFPQVNVRSSTDGDGYDGLEDIPTYMRAHAHAHEAATPKRAEPVTQSVDSLQLQATNPSPPAATQKPKRERSAAATQKAAEAREEKRQAAIAEHAGALIGLPALVSATGSVTAVSVSDAGALLGTITSTDTALTVDVEHTGYPVGHRDFALRTIQLGNEHFAVVLDATDAEHTALAATQLEAATILHAHSATADLVPLAHAGLIDIEAAWAKMHDTVVLAKLADPASTGSDPGLKKLAQAVLREAALSPAADDGRKALFKAGKWLTETKAHTPLERSGWAQVDHRTETMIRYDASDVIDDAALALRLPRPAPALLERENLAQRMTARVANTGLRLDPEHTAAKHAEQTAALADASARLGGFGIENPGSDAQVAAALERLGAELPRTATGRPSVAKGAIDQYASAGGDLGVLVKARLDYQSAENRLGLFLDGYTQLITNGDGRARPTVYTLAADTGRMSCVRPNLQQVPREGGYRACIIADPGHVLISADFSGVELRVAAALSQDQNLMSIVADPERDIHREIAQLVWGAGAGKSERYAAKRKVFGRLYGSGLGGLVKSDPPVSEAIARSIIDAMDLMTPGLSEWSRQVADAVESGRTQFQAYSGRTIYMPTDRGYAAPNYCIQGTARELLIDGLVRWSGTRWGNAVLLPVHDELVVHVPEDDADEATAALVDCMASNLAGVDIVAEPSEPTFAWADSA